MRRDEEKAPARRRDETGEAGEKDHSDHEPLDDQSLGVYTPRSAVGVCETGCSTPNQAAGSAGGPAGHSAAGPDVGSPPCGTSTARSTVPRVSG